MPPLSPQPSTCVLHGGTAFAPSTMGRSRGGGLGGLVKPIGKGGGPVQPWPLAELTPVIEDNELRRDELTRVEIRAFLSVLSLLRRNREPVWPFYL